MAILPPETNRARHIGGGERAAFTTLFFWSCSLESPRMNARFNPKLGLLVCTLLVAACVSNPSPKVLSEVRTQANPIDRSARAVTNFTPALRCMDEMLFNQGVRDITLMMEEFRDVTQKLPVATRDMMISAVSDMTRRSRAVRLSVFGTETKFSVLGFDAAMVETESMRLLPGVSSKNLTVLASRDASAGDGEAKLTNPGLDVVFSFAASRSEGTAQAARNMVELALVELVGKLVRLPYWQCVKVSDQDPEVQREMEDWCLSMDAAELRSFLQERMRERRYYDGATDGQERPAFTRALTTYRAALGLSGEGPTDLGFFKHFITVPVPRGPLAALPRAGKTSATSPTAAESALSAPSAVAAGDEPVAATLSLRAVATTPQGLSLEVQSKHSGYVYCYSQDPVSQKIVRIFPNRFVRDPRIEAGQRIRLPDGQRFVLNPASEYACLHAPREVYADLPPPLRWGDFEEIRLKSFDEIQHHFSQLSGTSIELQRLSR